MENVNSGSDSNETANQTLNLSKLADKIPLEFHYEINGNKLEFNDNGIIYLDNVTSKWTAINYTLFHDKLRPLPKIIQSDDPKYSKFNHNEFDKDFEEIKDEGNEKLYKASFVKRLVSKQKRRFQDSEFDLDMSYITDKVIAMGYPSTGIEVMYRNSLSDIIRFFKVRHNNKVKIYNLCLEKDRIYNKEQFPGGKVGLFPATDHFPCPIKLILEFCIDLCLYIIKNPEGVAAVHCKAGKGRTGVMICSYLIFSGLCETSEKAFRYYARVRTKNNTGITIASQRRYIKYFESFLQSNFSTPYMKLIPKIIRTQFPFLINNNEIKITNILQSFQKEKSYFISPNKFKIKSIKLGPLPKGKELKIKICNFVDSKYNLNRDTLAELKGTDSKGNIYYGMSFQPQLVVHSDIMIEIKKKLNFFLWVNLWYSTWELVKNTFDKNYVPPKKKDIEIKEKKTDEKIIEDKIIEEKKEDDKKEIIKVNENKEDDKKEEDKKENDKKEDDKKEEVKKEGDKKEEDKKEENIKIVDKKEEDKNEDDKKDEEKKEEDKKEEGKKEEEKKDEENKNEIIEINEEDHKIEEINPDENNIEKILKMKKQHQQKEIQKSELQQKELQKKELQKLENQKKEMQQKENQKKEDAKKIEDKKIEEKKKEEKKNDIIIEEKDNTIKEKIIPEKEEENINSSLNDIIYKLKDNTNLIELINTINTMYNMKIDRQNMKLILKADDFDKFKEISENRDIQLDIFYSLTD